MKKINRLTDSEKYLISAALFGANYVLMLLGFQQSMSRKPQVLLLDNIPQNVCLLSNSGFFKLLSIATINN